ncbi:type III secretion system translocon protein SseD [Yersinia aldovae]|uniref:type III secretion system effector protein n=1 Tax=Yersinia aldovae TaxID=29483 RepID=UPI0021BD998A|nr:type III secretion system effector protein [Yersinia aldovae]
MSELNITGLARCQPMGTEDANGELPMGVNTVIVDKWPLSNAQASLKSFASEGRPPVQIGGSDAIHGGGSASINPDSFFAMFDEIWSKLLMLAKQLRDTMQFYNQKKQELGWGLEINTLKQSFKAIDDSYEAAKSAAIGGLFAGVFTLAGAPFGEAGMSVGNAAGQAANGIANWVSASKTREADAEKAIADLQNKGAQSYAKTLDDTLMKAREIMQQMMDMGRSLVEVFSQVLRAISH